jgi:hypothetical protein
VQETKNSSRKVPEGGAVRPSGEYGFDDAVERIGPSTEGLEQISALALDPRQIAMVASETAGMRYRINFSILMDEFCAAT